MTSPHHHHDHHHDDHHHHDHRPAPILTARFDRPGWPGRDHGDAPLGLHIRFTPPAFHGPGGEGGGDAERRPLGLALVIDRSGSMSGAPLEAAKAAALQLQDQLGVRDRRAIVAFDNQVTLIAPLGSVHPTTPAERDRLLAESAAVRQLQPGGSTALCDGWQTGARLLENGELAEDSDLLTVVLSDGQGNSGITDPVELGRLATATASWGVRTTCVGIGRHYSTPQLAALADGGQGAMHQASTPEEIVECVLGELGRVRDLAARDVELEILMPHWVTGSVHGGRGDATTDIDPASGRKRIRMQLADAVGDRAMDLAATMRRVPGQWPTGDPVRDSIAMTVRWRCAVTGEPRQARLEGPGIDAATGSLPVPLADAPAGAPRDCEAAEVVMRLWHALLFHQATSRNEAGDFEEAGDLVDRELPAFAAFARGLRDDHELIHALRRLEGRARHHWDGMSKKELMIASRKMVMNELELRSAGGSRDHRPREDFYDYMNRND